MGEGSEFVTAEQAHLARAGFEHASANEAINADVLGLAQGFGVAEGAFAVAKFSNSKFETSLGGQSRRETQLQAFGHEAKESLPTFEEHIAGESPQIIEERLAHGQGVAQ